MRVYDEFTPTFPDRDTWSLAHVLRERAQTHGDRVALDFPLTGERWTYAELLGTSERIARHLLANEIEAGDRLVIMCANRPEVVFAWVAAAVGGLVEVPINTAYRGSFLEHQLGTVDATAYVIDPEFAERLIESRSACGALRRIYVTAAEGADAAIALLRDAGWQADLFTAAHAGGDSELPTIDVRKPCAIFFTSGTTGPSKGVVMSHMQMAFFADELRALTRLTDADAYMAVGPMFHGNSQFLAAYPILIAGGRFVLRERFSASRWSAWLRESQVTVTNLIGVMMDFVWKAAPTAQDADNPLRCVFAIPTATQIVDQFKQRFGIDVFVESYGMTEVSMPMLTPYGQPYPAGSCGLLVEDWYEVRIVDPQTDEELPPGEVGELLVRSKQPWLMNSGYYRMPERTVDAYRNFWFHTGDGVRRDADGWFYFVDRLNDTIRRRGENISSYELEQTVLEHVAVIECAAVAAPADEGGEDEIAVFVVATAEGAVEIAELRDWCEHRLPRFAIPRDVHLVRELPKTPSGKIRKAELRALARELLTTAASER
ncbi:AMP-binding protein [Conexibacter sp. CPCC 206217]|uniref:AMP-binding protein n=1 Tax=Conexibacter sp. CPCC 206217 TaxID=3064574 RepID=UPI0027283D08|nr:AMP-binding protein [Conexibacter sp. CPCC 206217]MDO8208881.1 AMP-binding protein [Conexibacter sp. CPCC 206217]